jgi:hypothetical protein
MGIERRQSPRRELVVEAVLTSDGMVPTKVTTRELGRFGMSLTDIEKPLAAGQVVGVWFYMFDAGHLQKVVVRGRVSHCMKDLNDCYRAGLQFISLDAVLGDLFSKYVG